MKRYAYYLILAGVAVALMNTGVIAQDKPFKSLKDYPDHAFNV